MNNQATDRTSEATERTIKATERNFETTEEQSSDGKNRRSDAQCPVEFGIEIADLTPNAKLTIFEQSNHNPFIEEEEVFKEFVQLTL